MWECNYAKESLDLKLLILRFMKKIWIPIIAALFGAAVFGGGHFIKNVIFAGEPRYEKVSIYFVEYTEQAVNNNEYYYINDFTWNEWVHTDEFLDRVMTTIEGSGYQVTKEEMSQYFGANLPSDLRMPYSTVTTYDPELTEVLGKALEQAFVVFGENNSEMNSIRVSNSGEVQRVQPDVRTLRAVILGAVIGLFAALVILLIRFLLDDSIYIPGTFTYRYQIPMLGVLFAKAKDKANGMLAENVNYIFRGKKQIAVTSVEAGTDIEAAVKMLPREDFVYICVPSPEQTPEAAKCLREADGVLLLVESGAGNGKRIEKVLDFLKTQDISVQGAVLWNGDAFLNRIYYGAGFGGKKK